MALLLVGQFPSLKAQQSVNTLYFMKNVPLRHKLNPSFQPLSDLYISLPAISYIQLGFWNNSLTLRDVIYTNTAGESIYFFHPDGDKQKFYNLLKNSTLINLGTQIELLGFGFRKGPAYWSFDASLKVEGNVAIPKSLMSLLLFGTPDKEKPNNFDLSKLGLDLTAYSEYALGYSRQINEQLTVGGKVKFLSGLGKASLKNSNTKISASLDKWNVQLNGTLDVALPGDLYIEDHLDSVSYTAPAAVGDFLKSSGAGGAIDIGAEFKIMDQLTLSAAITDIGFISWNNNLQNISYKADYTFDGLGDLNDQDLGEFNFDTILNALKQTIDLTRKKTAFSSWLAPKIHLGAEYAFSEDKMSVGLFSKTTGYNGRLYEEMTASFNARPVNWFNFSLSYSIMNGHGSTIGAGLGLRTGPFHWTLAGDYLAFRHASIPVGNANVAIPYNSKALNVVFGLSLTIGNKKDADKDGVLDDLDLCPETPRRVKVDENGCPIDSDGDGVPDYIDECPDTPIEARGFVNENGCPRDNDGDGVPDYLDKCPDTPAGIAVDEHGCPPDGDGDGVPDYKDECPGTPAEARGFVDEVGCLKDSDGDGVADYMDKCPGTPRGVEVDKNGCPISDSDGDGVYDQVDRCPNTPVEARGFVDENGCPRDTDGDGVPDYLDKCPTIAGPASNNGCPELTHEVRRLFQRALQGIQFEIGKATILKSSYGILNEIADMLKENPDYLIEVQGHTDITGSKELNMRLSNSRAAAVRDYLIGKGINKERMTSKGYGMTLPVADNNTVEGRAKNRRVEFIVTFERVVSEPVNQ
jgi:outer membrane protein OmpA-like peptidoglycan-associated protein